MKNLLVVLALALYCSNVSAQWVVGPKVGFGSVVQSQSDFRVFPNSDRIYELTFTGGTSVRSIGLMGYRDLGPFFIQAEVLATTYGQKYRLDSYNSNESIVPEYMDEFYIFEIPLSMGVLINKNFKLGVGHVMDVFVDKDSDFSSMYDYKDNTDKLEHGFQILLGYKIGMFHIDMRYVKKHTSIADGFNFGSDDMKLNKSANRLTASLGFAF